MSPESVPRNADGPGVSPYDTWLSSGSRFLIEIAAWTAGPRAAGDLLGSPWWAIPTLAVLLVLPGLFNVPGDKHVTGVPTQLNEIAGRTDFATYAGHTVAHVVTFNSDGGFAGVDQRREG